MGSIFVGKMQRKVSKQGKERFEGWLGNVPVLGFWGTKDPDRLHILLDHKKSAYLGNKKPDAAINEEQAAQTQKPQ